MSANQVPEPPVIRVSRVRAPLDTSQFVTEVDPTPHSAAVQGVGEAAAHAFTIEGQIADQGRAIRNGKSLWNDDRPGVRWSARVIVGVVFAPVVIAGVAAAIIAVL